MRGSLISPALLEPGRVVEVTFRARKRLVVGSILHVEGSQVRIEDHQGACWTVGLGEVAVRAARPEARRRYMLSQARARAAALRRQLASEIKESRPFGREGAVERQEWHVEVDTPLGRYLYREREQPHRATLQAWSQLGRELAKAEAELARLDVEVRQPRPGGLIPDRVEVLALQALEREGLLSDDEAAQLRMWADFWDANPGADRGLVAEDGSIIPRGGGTR